MKHGSRIALWASLVLVAGVWLWGFAPSAPSVANPGSERAANQDRGTAAAPASVVNRGRVEAMPDSAGHDIRVASRGGEAVEDSIPTQRFNAADYQMGRMQIFGRFWRAAEREWDTARYRIAESEAEYLGGSESYQVYVYLRTCLDAPRSPGQGAQYLERIQQAAEHNDRLQEPDYLERVLERVDQGLVRCDGLEGDLEPMAIRWLTRAAERGYPLAQIAFYRSYRWLAGRKPYLIFSDPATVYRYRSLAPRFLRAAQESGHAEAFVELARAYDDGIIFERDPELAYAYALAAEKAGRPDLTVGRRLRGALADELDPVQQRRAREEARRLCDTYCL